MAFSGVLAVQHFEIVDETPGFFKASLNDEVYVVGHKDKIQDCHFNYKCGYRYKVHCDLEILIVLKPNPVFEMTRAYKKEIHYSNKKRCVLNLQ